MINKIIYVLIIILMNILIAFIYRKILDKYSEKLLHEEDGYYKKILPEEDLHDYIIDLWVSFDPNNIENYTKQQLVVICVGIYDAEINNGGLCQFFSNSSRAFAPIISESLEQINAKKHKLQFDNFIKENNIDIKDLDRFKTDNVNEFIEHYNDYPFIEFDREYYNLEEEENIYDLLIKYAKENYDKIINHDKKNKN